MRILLSVCLALTLALPVMAQEQKESPYDKDIQILQLLIEKNQYQTQLAQTGLKDLLQKRDEWMKVQKGKPEEKK